MSTTRTILIVDDDRAVCSSLQLLLKRSGYAAHSIYHARELEDALPRHRPDLVLLDMNFTIDTSGKQGLTALSLLQRLQPGIPVILMTGWATVQLAVEGMKRGARDFLAKPWDNASLLASIRTVFELDAAEEPVSAVVDDLIVGRSAALQQLLQKARQIAKTDASVLITGESGTGKELLAETIHAHSRRHDQAFVKVNLGGISSSLFESEMFGHKKGAYTGAHADRVGRFQKADRGTIFLDEIGELDPASQVKLLRVLQEKTFEVLGSSAPLKVDVRVISATNRNLQAMIAEGQFREDLFYRINLIHLHIPPLRERRDDIPELVERFARNTCAAYQLEPVAIQPEAINWLQQQDFEGNIRELKNLIERSILLNIGRQELREADFREHHSSRPGKAAQALPEVGQMTLEAMEIEMIRKALEFHHYSIAQTARSLGITRSSLYRRLEKYQIPFEPGN